MYKLLTKLQTYIHTLLFCMKSLLFCLFFFQVKRVWQRRRVHIADGELCLYHADESKPPVRLTLLTCQVKLPTESVDNDSILNHSTGGGGGGGNQHSTTSEGKLYFDLVSSKYNIILVLFHQPYSTIVMVFIIDIITGTVAFIST